jgi:hypothetical protein
MASANPGVSAAGEAAGRSALNPSAGPAAIGGMLVPGEEPEVEPSEQMKLQARLSSAVSDITKLANAMEALSVDLPGGGNTSSGTSSMRRDEDGESVNPPVPRDSLNGDSGVHLPRKMGAVGEGTHKLSDFAKVSRPTSDTPRQAASHYRA